MPAPHPSRRVIDITNLTEGPTAANWASFDRTLRQRNRSDYTRHIYRTALADLANRYPDHDLADLTRDQIKAHIAAQLDHLSASTVANHVRSMRVFYNFLANEDEGIITRSPMRGIQDPSIDDRPPPIISDEHILALLSTCSGKTFEDRRDTAMIRLFCEAGSPRIAEMAEMNVGDVDLRADMVTVTGKGRKTRSIPIGVKCGQALDRYIRIRSRQRAAAAPRLWLGLRGTNLTPSGITGILNRRTRQAGLPHIHAHQFRHTSAHDWADSGGSDAQAMLLFGWSSAEMPRRYGRAAATTRAIRAARTAARGDRL